MRDKVIPVAWLMLASLIIGGSVGFAARANADGYLSDVEKAYVYAYHDAVCLTLDEYPTGAGVMGVVSAIMDDGFYADDAVDVINAAVGNYCDRHWQLLVNVGKAARGERIAAT